MKQVTRRSLSVAVSVLLIALFATSASAATGSITGTVTDAGTALPIAGVTVAIYDSTGAEIFQPVTNASGVYSYGSLATGTYFVRTFNGLGYVDERYDNSVCLACSVIAGTPVGVVDGVATTGIDFALAAGGRVSGHVTDSVSSLPVAGVSVQLGNSTSQYLVSVNTDASGNYTTPAVPTGNYSARTWNSAGYINELWDNVRCINCTASTFPIAVTSPATTPNIDFALDPGARVGGQVTDSATSLPLSGVIVSIINATGYNFASGTTDGGGHYTTREGVPPGTYYIRTSNTAGYVDELHADVPCLEWSCETASATSVALSAPVTTTINFALSQGGRVSGTVTDASTALPIADVSVSVINSAGDTVASGTTNASGIFMTNTGLATGSYYVQTYNSLGYINEIYDNIPCSTSCSRSSASLVAVTAGSTTTGINFALTHGGRISGHVTNAITGLPLANVTVTILSGTGSSVTSGYTDVTGAYTTTAGVPTGTYYARTANNAGYLDEIYDDIPCAGCSVSAGTAIGVTVGTTTAGIDFALNPGGRISGRVSDIATSSPLAGTSLYVTNAAGTDVSSCITDGDGNYVTGAGLTTGNYYIRVSNELGYVNEMYTHVSCASGCSPAGGTAVAVTIGATTTGINLALTAGGRVEGTIIDNATASPIANATIFIENSAGYPVANAETDPLGHYRSGAGLPTGTYYARTSNTLGYIDERYDNKLCAGACSVTSGTPIAVTLGTTHSGVNFGLDRGGTITGTVRDATTSMPLAGISVTVSTPGFSRSFTTNSFGVYTAIGLPTGSYNLRTRNTAGYLDALYSGIPCYAGCSVDTGTAVSVTMGSTVSAINFNLARGARVTGTAIDAATSLPLGGVLVRIVNAAGTTVTSGRTDLTGVYITGAGIPAGSYYARTSNSNGYIDELYNNVPCTGDCSLALGTPITVTAGATTSGINFALAAGGRIAGTVTDSPTSAPIGDAEIDIFDASGRFVTYGWTDALGHYVTESGLPAGTYYAATYNGDGHIDEAYNNRSCPGEACTVIGSTPIIVSLGTTTSSIDFSLDRGGRISGRILNSATLTPLAGVAVYVYDSSGLLLTAGATDIEGNYICESGLPSGTYFARTTNSAGYVNRLYDGLPLAGGTNVTSGTPIPVTAGSTTPNINFLLTLGGRITGTVTDAASALPIPGVGIRIYDAAGNLVATASTDSLGHYISRQGLTTGTYHARTINSQGYVNRLYNGLACPGECATTGGTAIAVTTGSTTAGINFSLAAGARISGHVTKSGTGEAVPNVTVNLYDSGGAVLSNAVTDGTGNYLSTNGVPSGTYYAGTANNQSLVNVLYNGIACVSSCTPSSGTAIPLTAGSTTASIHFVLSPDTDPDGDGIASTVDRNELNGNDRSNTASNDFNDTPLGGTTSGTLSSRGGWTVKVGDVSPQGVDMSITGSGASAATASVCSAGSYEGVLLDVSGEAARITCSAAGSTTVVALVATPVLQMRKPVTGAGTVVDLLSGQSATMGSPVVASPENTQPIGVRFVDDTGATFGSLQLDPGESIDASVASGLVDLTVLTGTVVATINGTTTTLQEGEHQTFGSPAEVLDTLAQRVDTLLASGDIANKGIASAIQSSLAAARRQIGKNNPAATNELRALLTKLESYKKNGQITQLAYDALVPYIEAVIGSI